MTELERHLEEMGVMPVSKPKEPPVVYDYSFKDPRDENGEVPF